MYLPIPTIEELGAINTFLTDFRKFSVYVLQLMLLSCKPNDVYSIIQLYRIKNKKMTKQ